MNEPRYAQDEPFTIQGHWWLPAGSEKVAGDLRYDEAKLTLMLYGGLNDAQVASPLSARPDATEFPLVYGESLQHVPITLLRLFYTNWTPDITLHAIRPGTRVRLLSSQLHSHVALVGVHLSSPTDGFRRCRIDIPHLETWLGAVPFNVNVESSFNEMQISYTRPQGECFAISSMNSGVRIVHTVQPPALPLGQKPAIVHRSYLEIEGAEPKPLTWFLECAGAVVDLLSLLYGDQLLSRRLMLYKDASDHDGVSVYYGRHRVTIPAYEPMDFVVGFESIKPSFAQILENWLKASEAEKRARAILLSSERRPADFIELRFLPLVHAAEVLANEGTQLTIVPKKSFVEVRKRMLKALPAGLPEELVVSIKSSLGWANGRSLKSKLLSMLSGLQEETCRLFCVEKAKFVAGIVNTRNHYTHYSAKPGDKLLAGTELHWASRKTSLMLRVLLLLRAGIPEGDLRSMVDSHHHLNQERSVWTGITEEGSALDAGDPA